MSSNESLVVKEPCKLGNFLALSEKAKSRARSRLERRSHVKDYRKERKSSILNSLDKFLDDDDATDTTSYQSSFSSGLSSEASATSFPRSLPPRVEPTLEGDEQADSSQPPRRRFQRRGSVTRYSLEGEATRNEDTLSRNSQHSIGESSIERKSKKKPQSSLLSSSQHSHKSKSKNHVEAIASSKHREIPPRPRLSTNGSSSLFMDQSARSIDERPIPMRDNSIQSIRSFHLDDNTDSTTIDDRPLPMRLGDSTTSFDTSSFGGDSVEERRPPPSRRASNSKGSTFYDSFASTASMCSFDDDDSSSHHQPQPRLPPRPKKRNSLAGLDNLPSATPSTSDDHLQEDRSITSHSTQGEGGGRQRYRRRGSVTRYSLGGSSDHDRHQNPKDESALSTSSEHRPPRPQQRQGRLSLGNMLNTLPSTDKDDHLQDDRSVSGNSEGRQRYRRRGSVTRYSLEDSSAGEDDRSAVSEHLPPRPSAVKRTASLTKPKKSLSGMLTSSKSEAQEESEDKSINSEGILGGGRQRYRRRGSVTRYSIRGGSVCQ